MTMNEIIYAIERVLQKNVIFSVYLL